MKERTLKKILITSVIIWAIIFIALLVIFSLPILPAKANEIQYTAEPVITILTHGAGVAANSWTGENDVGDLTYNPQSIVEQLYNKNRNMDIYQIEYEENSALRYIANRVSLIGTEYRLGNAGTIEFNPNNHLLLVYQEKKQRCIEI